MRGNWSENKLKMPPAKLLPLEDYYFFYSSARLVVEDDSNSRLEKCDLKFGSVYIRSDQTLNRYVL